MVRCAKRFHVAQPGPDETIRFGRSAVNLALEHRVQNFRCPCCGRLVFLYARTLYFPMALVLRILYEFDKQHPGEYCHVERVAKSRFASVIRGGDWAKAKYWGLYEAAPKWYLAQHRKRNPDLANPRGGMWRITMGGKAFVEGKTKVARQAFVFDDRAYRFSEKQTTWAEAWARRGFKYADIIISQDDLDAGLIAKSE